MTSNNVSNRHQPHFLYRHFDEQGQLLYVGVSLNAINRLSQHKETAKWFSMITRVTIESFETRAAALAAEQKAINSEHPIHNIKRKKIVSVVSKVPIYGGFEESGEPFICLTQEVFGLIRRKKSQQLISVLNASSSGSFPA